MSRRVVITGLGVFSSVGKSPSAFFDNLMEGRSGIAHLSKDFVDRLNIRIAAAIKDYEPAAYFSKIKLTGLDRFSQFALIAGEQAVTDSKLILTEAERERAGVYIGTGMGGAGSVEDACIEVYTQPLPRVKPLTVLLAMNNAAASHLSLAYQFQGPNVTYSTACASSSIAIGEAFRHIKHGYAEVMLAGGSEAILYLASLKAWEALRTLATEDSRDPAASCKPFSKDRTGLVVGEGAAVLVLEDAERALARGAHIYAEVVGYDCTSDASHITKPDALGQARTIRNALIDAGLEPSEIDYINAHGTATLAGDVEESKAIKQVFGEYAHKIPISSTKSMHGHVMGATGAVEFTAAILAIENQAIPPTINLNQPDPECDLDYVPNAGRRNAKLETVMSNSFAFGGTNAVLIAKKFKP